MIQSLTCTNFKNRHFFFIVKKKKNTFWRVLKILCEYLPLRRQIGAVHICAYKIYLFIYIYIYKLRTVILLFIKSMDSILFFSCFKLLHFEETVLNISHYMKSTSLTANLLQDALRKYIYLRSLSSKKVYTQMLQQGGISESQHWTEDGGSMPSRNFGTNGFCRGKPEL